MRLQFTDTLPVLMFAVGCDSPQPVENNALRPAIGDCPDTDARDAFVQCVDEFRPASDAEFGHDLLPNVVMGAPMGSDSANASLDVVSLGCGGDITLFFGRDGIPNRKGPDFTIFENPLSVGNETFAEPAIVLVSSDGLDWAPFECELDEGWPPTGCAGIQSVAANPQNNTATDARHSGGDSFDLEDVQLDVARYIRILDKSIEYYGGELWCGAAGGFDLDAVARVEAPP